MIVYYSVAVVVIRPGTRERTELPQERFVERFDMKRRAVSVDSMAVQPGFRAVHDLRSWKLVVLDGDDWGMDWTPSSLAAGVRFGWLWSIELAWYRIHQDAGQRGAVSGGSVRSRSGTSITRGCRKGRVASWMTMMGWVDCWSGRSVSWES